MKKVEGFALTNWGSKKFEVYADSEISISKIVELVREKLCELDAKFCTCTIVIQRITDYVYYPDSGYGNKIIINI